jgi:hypothetical protein
MPTEWEQNLHDLVASIRAACTALADPTSGPALNGAVGVAAYTSSPQASIGVLASMSAHRLERRNEALPPGQPTGFPREELEALLPERRPSSRSSADEDCLDFLEAYVAGPVPDVDRVQALIDTHGLVAFMRIAHINNLVGQLLVDVDPAFGSLQELMAAEALADETEWGTWDQD